MDAETFKKIYTQFSEISDDEITRHLNDFLLFFKDISFASLQDTAQGLYCAHILTLLNSSTIDKDNIDSGLSGKKIVSQEKTPEFTITYGVPSAFIEGKEEYIPLKQTIYGYQLLCIIYKVRRVAIVV